MLIQSTVPRSSRGCVSLSQVVVCIRLRIPRIGISTTFANWISRNTKLLQDLRQALLVPRHHIMRSSQYKGSSSQVAKADEGSNCPFESATSLGLLFVVACCTSHRNAKLGVQAGFVSVLKKLFVSVLAGRSFDLPLLPGADGLRLMVNDLKVDINSLTVFLCRFSLRRRFRAYY
jgi:hypothetical protein